MKKFLISLFCGVLSLLSACGDSGKNVTQLSADEIYFFYQNTCPHCHDAARYIKAKYPDLEVVSLDVKLPGNMRLFEKAVRKYKIDGSRAGTPLICMGDKYIMGWSKADEHQFEVYVKPYLKK